MAWIRVMIQVGDDKSGYPPGNVKQVLVNGTPVEMDDRQNGSERVWFLHDDPDNPEHTIYLTEESDH